MIRNYIHRKLLNSYSYSNCLSSTVELLNMKTAGIIVIGDEILKGEVVDTNSSYMTSRLHKLGVKVKKVPASAKLTFGEDLAKHQTTMYPNISVKNVYMFPGIPQLMEKSFDILSPILFQSSSKFFTINVYFNVTEDKIAKALDCVTKEYADVVVGSYPQLFHSGYKVKITIESTDEEVTSAAFKKLMELVPADIVVDYISK